MNNTMTVEKVHHLEMTNPLPIGESLLRRGE